MILFLVNNSIGGTMKRCSKCGETKAFELFAKDKRKSLGLSSWCKVCSSSASNACTKKRIAEDPEYAKARAKRSSDCERKLRAADPEYNAKRLQDKRAISAKRYAEDPVFVTIRREQGLQWARDNRDRHNAKSAKRRAAELRATPPWYQSEHEAVCELYRKAWQLSNKTGIVHHVDHIVPLQGKNVSGLHCLANLQILTAQENLSKSNKHYA